MTTMKKTHVPAFSGQRGVFISWKSFAIFLVAIIAVALIGLLAYWLRGTDSERGTRMLVQAFSKRRLIEPRLSGGFKGGAFNLAQAGMTDINASKVEQATELIENAFDESVPHSRLAYGRLLLSKGGKGADALKHLRMAVSQLQGNAEPYNDLGVCLMEQGKLEDALEEFNLALKSKPDMKEALFNRGLCYERLLLRDAASEDYSRLLEIEGDRTWTNEIKQRQQEVSASITPAKQQDEIVTAFKTAMADGNTGEAERVINNNLEIMIKHAYSVCPKEYFKAVEAKNQEQASQILSEMTLIGSQFISTSGDTSIAEMADYLGQLTGDKQQTERKLIEEYLEAENRLLLQKATDMQPTFERLIKQFQEQGNDLFQFFSMYCAANCDYASGLYSNSIEKLKQALTLVDKHNWPYRRANINCQLGIVYSRLGQDALAIKYCEQALEQSRGAYYTEAKALQFMGNASWHLGDISNGLSHLRKSTGIFLKNVSPLGDLASNSLLIAEFYRLLNNHSLAQLYAKQALNFAEQSKNNNLMTQAASFLALEDARLNQFDRAEAGLKLSFGYSEKIDSRQRAYTESLALMRAGEIAALRNDSEQAVGYYSKAEASIEQSQEKIITMMKILRGRAEAYVKGKEYAKARADLERASQFIEDYRANISDRKNRSDFLDASQSVFDEMILLNARAFANWPVAFNVSEQSRARTLLDDLPQQQSATNAAPTNEGAGNLPANHTVDPLTLSEVQAALPDDLSILTYSVTSQGTFIFFVSRSGFEYAESPVTTEKLDRLTQDYLASLKSMAPADELKEKARELYLYLIKPIEAQLGTGGRLCIVPDKGLHFLPFAALTDESGKYLIESYRMDYAPSASVLVRCLTEARLKGTASTEKILAVGNPLFNKEKLPDLKDLPDAEREASQSAALYKKSIVLNGKNATKQRVYAALKDCDVAHLSLHCLVEEKSPLLATLVLAEQGPEAGVQPGDDDGLLYLNEIYGMSLPRMRLVILSACESGLGQYYRGEGIVSLVRPFLALKVPTVVASLWSVDSQATAGLMIDFHKERKINKLGVGEALRTAQIKMAHSAPYRHPYYWAPFIAVGSNS